MKQRKLLALTVSILVMCLKMQQNQVAINNLAVLRQQMENHFLAEWNMFLLIACMASGYRRRRGRCVNRRRRRAWVWQRPQHWFDTLRITPAMDPLGRPNFRMNKATFDTLCETLRLDLQKQHTQYRDPVSVETRVACGIWRLATGDTFWACGLQFGLGTATAWIISREFEEALCNRADDYIHFPTTDEETDEVIQQFEEEYKFPQIVGAIDGCRIENKAPIQNPEDYNTRKQFYGVTLQGIADCNLLFRHISVGFPGCIHDARVLEISGINNLANNKHILNSPARTIRDVELRPMLAGDSAYPLSSWLLKPFSRRRNLLRHERKLNKKFSAMRSVIERAFGMLKFRWQMEEG